MNFVEYSCLNLNAREPNNSLFDAIMCYYRGDGGAVVCSKVCCSFNGTDAGG